VQNREQSISVRQSGPALSLFQHGPGELLAQRQVLEREISAALER
jgi:hypothetical protein